MAKRRKSRRSRKHSRALTTIPKPHGPVLVAGRRRRRGRVGASPFSPKRGMTAAAKAAYDQKHTVTALAAAGAAGYLDGQGSLASIPDPMGIGAMGMLAIGAFAGAKLMKNKTLDHVATGLGSIAVFQLAKGAAGGGTAPASTQGYDYEDW